MQLLKYKKGYSKISDEDFIEVSLYKWSDNGNGYLARRGENNEKIFLHRFIANRMGLNLLKNIDHINGNKLDNQRENIRESSYSQNGINRPKPINNTSGYKGIRLIEGTNLWIARLGYRGKNLHIGVFDTKEDANRAYMEVAQKLFGDFADYLKDHTHKMKKSPKKVQIYMPSFTVYACYKKGCPACELRPNL